MSQSYFKTLLNSLKVGGKRFVSIEVFWSNEFNVKDFQKLNLKLCSISWFPGDLDKPESLPGLSTAQLLLKTGTDIIVHVGGRNLNSTQAKNVLDSIKGMGVKNILALKGGMFTLINITNLQCKCNFLWGASKFLQVFHFGHTKIPFLKRCLTQTDRQLSSIHMLCSNTVTNYTAIN